MTYLYYFGTFVMGITLIIWAQHGNGGDKIIEKSPVFMFIFLIAISVVGLGCGVWFLIDALKGQL